MTLPDISPFITTLGLQPHPAGAINRFIVAQRLKVLYELKKYGDSRGWPVPEQLGGVQGPWPFEAWRQ